MNELAQKQCVPCKGDVPALTGDALKELQEKLGGGWEVKKEHHLYKKYDFADFQQALEFTNRVGAVAEEQNHHPDIKLGYGRVELEIHTHTIDGLTESDFILAAKADAVR